MVTEIKNLCQKQGMTIKSLEIAIGLPNGSIRRWDESSPAVDKVLRVSQFFGVSIESLLGVAPVAPASGEETRLLAAWRQADEKTRRHVAIELEDYGFLYHAKEKNAI